MSVLGNIARAESVLIVGGLFLAVETIALTRGIRIAGVPREKATGRFSGDCAIVPVQRR